jgi:hypothetical protein
VVLDTVAACHAECGDFAAAAAYIEEALKHAEPAVKPALREHLALYKSSRPCREVPKPAFKPTPG